jgi:hypothetical protein
MITGQLNHGKVAGIPIKIGNQKLSTDNVQVSGLWDGQKLNVHEVKASAINRVMREGFAFNIQTPLQLGKGPAFALGKPINIDKNTTINGNNKNTLLTIQGLVDKSGRATATSIQYQAIDKVLERPQGKEHPTITPKNSEKNSRSERVQDRATLKSDQNDHHTSHHEITDKQEKIEHSEAYEKIELTEKVERSEKVERPEKVEVPEKVEKPEKVEVPEKVEKPETHDD